MQVISDSPLHFPVPERVPQAALEKQIQQEPWGLVPDTIRRLRLKRVGKLGTRPRRIIELQQHDAAQSMSCTERVRPTTGTGGLSPLPPRTRAL